MGVDANGNGKLDSGELYDSLNLLVPESSSVGANHPVFTNEAAEKGKILDRDTPDAETVKQALDYRKALARRPDWKHPIDVAVVEVCGSAGYNWFELPCSKQD